MMERTFQVDSHSQIMRKNDESLRSELQALGLNCDKVLEQIKKVKRTIFNPVSDNVFEVIDSCTTTNGRLFTISDFNNSFDEDSSFEDIIAFIPAAGAASRYKGPLNRLVASLDQNDDFEMQKAFAKDIESKGWILPGSLAHCFKSEHTLQSNKEHVINLLNFPKALWPCVIEGLTFLEMKNIENHSLGSLGGQVFISSLNHTHLFKDKLDDLNIENHLKTIFLEQGLNLSTIRINLNGSLVRDKSDNLSVVPAGHGSLIELFPKVKIEFPSASTLFIKNIDNVIGTSNNVIESTQDFLQLHKNILRSIRQIRLSLKHNDLNQATVIAHRLENTLKRKRKLDPWETDLISQVDCKYKSLVSLQLYLFQTPRELFSTVNLQNINKLYSRPLNILGQVQNSGKDQGGTAVRVDSKLGKISICLEMVHASEKDQKKYFCNPQRSTHFNPVFVASELPECIDVYRELENEFWLLAKKKWCNINVCYYESLLYEILGNSYSSNCIFLEIPRFLFNPHKTLDDSVGRTCEYWGL